MSFKKDKRQEVIIYLVLWAMLFIAPVLSLAVRTSNTDIPFDWNEIFTVWKQYAVFFVVFLIHNHLMAPLLVYRQKKVWYLCLCLDGVSAGKLRDVEFAGGNVRDAETDGAFL